jgi:hypothetical protein
MYIDTITMQLKLLTYRNNSSNLGSVESSVVEIQLMFLVVSGTFVQIMYWVLPDEVYKVIRSKFESSLV